MKKLIAFAAFTAFFLQSQAQTIRGKITSAEDGQPLSGATITIKGEAGGVLSNETGEFEIGLKSAGTYELTATFMGFEPLTQKVVLQKTAFVKLELRPSNELLDPVNISAVRAGENVPIAKSSLNKSEIENRDEGRDMPFILKDMPSTIVNSDAGNGVGYTGIRIRGSDINHINVTINGIPLNDPESHGVFWVNTPDLASSAQSIQVQRGVGTSTNGAGAFGASINVKTSDLQLKPYASSEVAGGSFNTLKTNIQAGTGLLNNHWTVDARLSKIQSDGFIDRAASDLNSYYLSASYYSKNTSVQLIHFGGGEQTYQAWWGVPEVKLRGSQEQIQQYITNNGYTGKDAENLLNSDPRTYNYYTYDNETDNYNQDHYQLHFSHKINQRYKINAALHHTWGRGYYEQYKEGEDFSDYGLDPIFMGGDTIASTDLIRRRWLNNYLSGLTYSLQADYDNLQMTFGGAYNTYIGDHYGEIIWARYASNSEIRDRYYDNTSLKTDFNTFLKANYSLKKLDLYVDIQMRSVQYSGEGVDDNGANIDIDRSFAFLNPKLGVNYKITDKLRAYASWSVGQREPVRSDFLDARPGDIPESEYMMDYEAGYEYTSTNTYFNANLFYMDYTNQLVLTGEVNDVGAPIRVNVDKSYRAGIELSGSQYISQYLHLGANLTLSQNKILDFTDYVVDYDNGGYQTTEYNSTDISFSPSMIGGISLGIIPVEQFTINLNTKFVSRQYLDNTSSTSKSLNPYTVTDLRLGYDLEIKGVKRVHLHALIANLLNYKYEANGYTYSYIYGQKITENFYFPMAGINYMAGIKVDF